MASLIWPGSHAALKRVKNKLIHSQSDIVSLIFLLPIIVLCMIIQQE